MLKYTLKTITREDDHPASKYIDDEELIIVEDSNGLWYKADEFFYHVDVTEFFIEEG